MSTLRELYARHGSDKGPRYHDYAAVYEPLLEPLRGRSLTMLEIGIGAGGSLRAWQEYFPHARIYALDVETKPGLDSDRVTTGRANQSERKSLVSALTKWGMPEFDLVIDDGGHRMKEQQVSLGVLFPFVRPGGLYVIEDVHTSFPELYPDYGVDPDGANSTYAMIDRFARTGQIESPYLGESARYLTNHIAWASYHFRPTRRHSDLAVFLRKDGA